MVESRMFPIIVFGEKAFWTKGRLRLKLEGQIYLSALRLERGGEHRGRVKLSEDRV